MKLDNITELPWDCLLSVEKLLKKQKLKKYRN